MRNSRPSPFLPLRHHARLLKLSGRFLQTICLHVQGPSLGVAIEHTTGDDYSPSPSPLVSRSPALGPRRNSTPVQGRWSSTESRPHFNRNSVRSKDIASGEVGDERTLQELVAQLPGPVRLDVANRYLEVQFCLPRLAVLLAFRA